MRSSALAIFVAACILPGCSGSSGPTGVPEYTAQEGRQWGSGGGEAPAPEEPIPHGRLPEGVTPLAYDLWLEVVPTQERFTGRATIRVRLDAPRRLIWLHGAELHVTEAEVLPEGAEGVPATWRQEDTEGTASLRLASPVGPGEVTIAITYDAPFDRQLKGLYRVDTAGRSYAFTQFEATSARYAFPCFDEPRFKTPFDLTLSVRSADRAVANTTMSEEREIGSGMKEVRFATTERLPTYLVAMAVGPLDIVEHAPIPPNSVRRRPLPLRGIARHGEGPRLAYALERTGALLADLEQYFGTEYPYDKLDIVAVPDFASGAMENAGLITFREVLLLLDPASAPEDQRRSFAYVMAHELAHQWFGNLVTMPWWDDIWLNEAFATWMASKVIEHVYPDYHAELGRVESGHGAMRSDSLESARQIRQPIESNHDIRNAFDGITYRKGGAVLAMFERWLGEDVFRDGVREYMAAHRFGTATSDDLLDALGRVAGRDVATPFRTFLLQPGVPLLSVERLCDGQPRLRIAQSRYFPIGAQGERARSWQIPFCYRAQIGRAVREECALITESQQEFPIEGGCPAWVRPNASAAGSSRFALARADADALMQGGWSRLTPSERIAVADNLVAAFASGALDAGAVFPHLTRIASDSTGAVAEVPMGLVTFTRDQFFGADQRPVVERFADRLYRAHYRRLGFSPRRGEDSETALFRRSVISFLAFTARAADVRREAAERGRRYAGFGGDGQLHPEAVSQDLAGIVLAVAIQEGDAAFFDALLAQALASQDALFRGRAFGALSVARDAALGERALALSADTRLRVNEMSIPLEARLGQVELREGAWAWLQDHFDEVYGRVATTRAGYAPWLVAGFCDAQREREVAAFFEPRIEALPGGPRNLRGALEAIRYCAARREAQSASVSAFFARQR